MTPEHAHALAEKIADELINGLPLRAIGARLEVRSPMGQLVGGWSKPAAIERIAAVLSASTAKGE